MMKKIMQLIYHKIEVYIYNKRSIYPIIFDINKNYLYKQKTILISYLDYNQMRMSLLEGVISHTNRSEMSQMIKILIDMDFCIDVCDCNEERVYELLKKKNYDYIIGFGNNFRYAAELNKTAKKILYMTENPAEISENKEKERIEYFYERTKINVPYQRTGRYYKKGDTKFADFIICLGEEKFYDVERVYRLYPTGLYNKDFKLGTKNKDKNSFLWFGSVGAVHKGLDILIEIFKVRKDLKLYICGLSDNDIKRYKLDLSPTNIINMSFVDVNGEIFINLINNCTFAILPSCSEATSTSVITCMRHGLIPIVSNEIGFDNLHDYCEILYDYKVEYVEERINQIINKSEEELQIKIKEIYEYANTNFNLEAYTKCFTAIMNDIVEKTTNV